MRDNTGTIVLHESGETSEMTRYGERIRQIRNRLKINQGEFAELAGVTVRAQRSYEAGLRTPNISYLESLSAHGVDVGYILTGLDRQAGMKILQPAALAFHWLADQIGLDDRTRDVIENAFAELKLGVKEVDDELLQIISSTHSIGQVDSILLTMILEAVDGLSPHLSARKKAGVVSLLYRTFRSSGRVDLKAVKEAVDLAT